VVLVRFGAIGSQFVRSVDASKIIPSRERPSVTRLLSKWRLFEPPEDCRKYGVRGEQTYEDFGMFHGGFGLGRDLNMETDDS
jgi:hypothetical protein